MKKFIIIISLFFSLFSLNSQAEKIFPFENMKPEFTFHFIDENGFPVKEDSDIWLSTYLPAYKFSDFLSKTLMILSRKYSLESRSEGSFQDIPAYRIRVSDDGNNNCSSMNSLPSVDMVLSTNKSEIFLCVSKLLRNSYSIFGLDFANDGNIILTDDQIRHSANNFMWISEAFIKSVGEKYINLYMTGSFSQSAKPPVFYEDRTNKGKEILYFMSYEEKYNLRTVIISSMNLYSIVIRKRLIETKNPYLSYYRLDFISDDKTYQSSKGFLYENILKTDTEKRKFVEEFDLTGKVRPYPMVSLIANSDFSEEGNIKLYILNMIFHMRKSEIKYDYRFNSSGYGYEKYFPFVFNIPSERMCLLIGINNCNISQEIFDKMDAVFRYDKKYTPYISTSFVRLLFGVYVHAGQ